VALNRLARQTGSTPMADKDNCTCPHSGGLRLIFGCFFRGRRRRRGERRRATAGDLGGRRRQCRGLWVGQLASGTDVCEHGLGRLGGRCCEARAGRCCQAQGCCCPACKGWYVQPDFFVLCAHSHATMMRLQLLEKRSKWWPSTL